MSKLSGATWPIHKPVVPPENLPSVISKTSLPNPAPLIAAVICSISLIPGPPLGPSFRITTTSPFEILLLNKASKASCSESKTFAGPEKVLISIPAVFTTDPFGLNEPLRIAMPPSFDIGLSGKLMTFWFFGICTFSRFSPTVRPVTVMQSGLINLFSRSIFDTTGTPPISFKLTI